MPGFRIPMLAAGFLLLAAPAAAKTNLRIDPAHTKIEFVIDGVGWPATRGRFTMFAGKLDVDFERPEASRVEFRVAAKSVDVNSASFNDYLRTDAFFDVARFPELIFASTGFRKLDATHGEVTGDLTLRGITRAITLAVELDRTASADGKRLILTATGVIHRLAFGMNAGFPAISNDVHLTVTAQAVE